MKHLIEYHRGEAVCLLLLLATGVALLAGAAALPAPMFDPLGPAGLPRYIAYLLLALLAVRIVTLFRTSRAAFAAEDESNFLGAGERGIPRADETDGPQIVKLLLVAAITVAYLTALTIGGLPFTYLTLAYIAAIGAAMAELTPRKLIIVGAIAVVMSFVLTYTFTDILSVVLPG